MAIDMQGLLRSGIMTFATGAPVRVGLADAREGATWFYTHRIVAPIDTTHAVDRLLAIASAVGAGADVSPVVAIGPDDREWARSTLAGVGRPRLAINLGARWETKRWPPQHFAEIARRAFATRGAGLFALGAPEDRPFVHELGAYLHPIPILDLCARTSLSQIAALAEESDVVLSNDTGPLHLAAASGARVVGIYTCTSPELNGPYGPRAVSVQSDVWCKASYLVRCSRLECMSELTPDRVWPKVLEQIDASIAASVVG
jgi:ADP-heptose:LPS heptosyltransferase